MTVTADGTRPRVGRPRTLSTPQIGEVRAYLAYFDDRPRVETLKRLGVWPVWDSALAECEERMANEYAIGVEATVDRMLAAQHQTSSRLAGTDQRFETIEPLRFADEEMERHPKLSV